MYQILEKLRLSLRPEKTYAGRSQKGFSFLGYDIIPESFFPSKKTQEKAIEQAKRRYAQGGIKPLRCILRSSPRTSLKCWRTWCAAGLPFKTISLDDTLQRIETTALLSRRSKQEQNLVGGTKSYRMSTFLYRSSHHKLSPKCSVFGEINNKKGTQLCVQNSSKYQL